eukprot:486023_1
MKSFVVALIGASLTFAHDPIVHTYNWDETVTSGAPEAWTNPCDQSPLKGTPTCDTSKSFQERAHDLVYVQEAKLKDVNDVYQGLSGNGAHSVSELNIPGYQWWSEALHGVAGSPGVNYNGPIKATTMFPQVITTAASFNASLVFQIGTVISTEARAMWNNAQAGLTFWAPNINIFRDPRWGRGQETPGEDPFVNAEYATKFVRGMQEGSDKYIKASSCCKHYADYSLENADGYSRHNFNAIVSDYDQNDTYLVAFKYCAVGGNASSVMCSYNAENGVPSCANKDIMTTKLRDEWGFQGYITSDCGAVNDVENNHHYTKTPGATVDAVFSAGMDINCGGFTQKNTAAAISSGDTKLATVQQAMYNAALVQMRLGMFDGEKSQNTPWSSLGPNDVCTKSALKLAYDASRQGVVLLKNNKNTLPLKNTSIKSLANIGPNAKNTGVMEGNYHGNAPFIFSVQQGLQMYVSGTTYEQGVAMASSDTSGIAAAVNIAKTADATILVMGLDESQEAEGHDRTNISLPGQQNNCINQVANAAKGPVILVILSGGCVDIEQWKDSDKIDAIIWAGYPGMYGGVAIADVIFGAFNPTGRITQTFYKVSYMNEVKMDDMNMRPNSTTKCPGRGYRYYPGDVVYSFGSGMSYSSFTCGTVSESNGKLSVSVKNSGSVSSGAVVLVYFVPNNGGTNGVELKRLVAFGRVDMLSGGQSSTLNMDLYPEFLNGPEHQKMDGKYVASCPGP